MTQFRSTIATRFIGQVRAQEALWANWTGPMDLPAAFYDRAISIAQNLSLARQTLLPGSLVPDIDLVRRAASSRNI